MGKSFRTDRVCCAAVAGLLIVALPALGDPSPDVGLRLTFHSVHDPQVHNWEAFRILKPPRWSVRGGIVWRHDLSNLAHAQLRIASPDGHTAVELFPILPYTWPPNQFFGPGQNYLGNLIYEPVEPGVFVTKMLAPALRGGVQRRFVSRTPLNEVVQMLRRDARPIDGLENRILGERVRIEYSTPGGTIEEDIYCVMTYSTSTRGITQGTTF